MHSVSDTSRPEISLRATNLTKLYGETVALWNVDLAARGGELVAVLGPNASGKTTLLRILAGLTAPTGGRISWSGSSTGRPRIAYVGHATHLFEALTPLENLELAARLAGRDPRLAVELLGRLGIESSAGRRCGGLSAGTLRRVALARALATAPDALILDEPFASLDGAAADVVVEVLAGAGRDGRLVVVATHDDARSRILATKSVWLSGGRVAPPDSRTTGTLRLA